MAQDEEIHYTASVTLTRIRVNPMSGTQLVDPIENFTVRADDVFELAQKLERRGEMLRDEHQPSTSTAREVPGERTVGFCAETNFDERGDHDGPESRYIVSASQWGRRPNESVILCGSHAATGQAFLR